MAGYSREQAELEIAELEHLGARANRAVAEGLLSGLDALRVYAAIDMLISKCRRRLTAVARAVEDRQRDKWREQHVIAFPARRA